MPQSFDVVVIGGGPGGFGAAVRAGQLGFKTACIDDWKTPDSKPALGGTCTNIGCIPSKALLQSSENFEQAGHGFAEHGVRVKGLELDLAQMLKRKDQVVKASNDGVVYLFKKNKIAFFHGRGSFAKSGADGCEIAVKGDFTAVGTRLREAAAAVKERDLVLLEEIDDSIVARLHHLVLALEHLREVELQALHAHAVLGEAMPGLLEILRGLQQRLRGNA